MQQLIDDDARVLVFAHGDGMQSCAAMTCPEGIMYTYDHFAQTNDKASSGCDATSSQNVDDYGYFLMNHFKNDEMDLPSESNAEGLNAYDSLEKRFGQCVGRTPNLVAVDFWDVGELLTFAKDRNIVMAAKMSRERIL
jgi:hypothetical protein